jgi:PIN domain nuclease of toxin-antitoxin system
MFAAVADTHTAIWYIFASPLLSQAAKNAIDGAAAQGDYVGVSAISLAEIVYLIEKQRIPLDTLQRLTKTLADPNEVLAEAPLDSTIVEFMTQIPRADVPDLPDRVVAATGLRFGIPVITRDRKIQTANVQTIW